MFGYRDRRQTSPFHQSTPVLRVQWLHLSCSITAQYRFYIKFIWLNSSGTCSVRVEREIARLRKTCWRRTRTGTMTIATYGRYIITNSPIGYTGPSYSRSLFPFLDLEFHTCRQINLIFRDNLKGKALLYYWIIFVIVSQSMYLSFSTKLRYQVPWAIAIP